MLGNRGKGVSTNQRNVPAICDYCSILNSLGHGTSPFTYVATLLYKGKDYYTQHTTAPISPHSADTAGEIYELL